MTKENGLKALAAVLSGWLLACSFPLPPGLEGLEGGGAAWMALIPLILVSIKSPPRKAFLWGFLSGMVFWLISLSWLLALRNTWGNIILPALGWVLLSAYCSLYMGLFCLALSTVSAERPEDQARRGWLLLPLAAAPVFWVGTEMLRSVLFSGFPWNLLGVSQYQNVAAIQLASLGGVYAVSALIVLLNTALALTILSIGRELFIQGGRRRRVHLELMIGLGIVAVFWSWGVRTVRRTPLPPDTETLRIAAIQPAVPQEEKWTEAYEQDIYSALQGQTELALLSRPDLVVWPETATPGMLRTDPLSHSLAQSLASQGAWLLAGSMDALRQDDRVLYYNASFLLSSGGELVSSYYKRHLVLFGETLPFEEWFPFVQRWAPLGFSCRRGEENPALIRIAQVRPSTISESRLTAISVLICFEDVFPYLARRDVRRGARLLVNQTNNAWFDGSSASRQHMANAVLRTVENRVPLVRAANTGITGFVDRFGRITERFVTDSGESRARGFLVSEVRVSGDSMQPTLYTRFGDWIFGWPCLFLTLMALVIPSIRHFRTVPPGAPESD